jgi:hypothetical protein
MTQRRVIDALLIGLGIVALILLSSPQQVAFLYQNF